MMNKLQYGAFVRNIPGIYNSTWTDMFIETTCMRMWHGHTGAIGVAADYHQMAKWALSFDLSGEVSQGVRSFSNAEQDSHHTRHKEEVEGRIKTDQPDRMRDKLDVCIGLCLSPRWFTHEHCPKANNILRTPMSMQLMPLTLYIGQWKTSRVDGRIHCIALSAS